AYWMGGISSLYTTLEKVEIQSATVSKVGFDYNITMLVRNTGSKDATIDSILLNQKPMLQYVAPPTLSVNYTTSANVVAGGSCTVVVHVKQTSAIPPFTPGTTIEVKLHTAAGKEYPQMVTLT
ncbi:hypothetical protein MUP00_06010, partial [Candidatus Bathyarchaeota archaeon]|nr:hypothetical protein [Candidatus Bathyarchaeota archaeon]